MRDPDGAATCIYESDGEAVRKLRRAAFFVFLALLVPVLASGSTPALADEDDEAATGEIVAKIDPRSGATIDQINQRYGTSTKDAVLASGKIYLLQAPASGSTEDLTETMESDRSLLYAEPNYIVETPEGNPRHRARSDYAPAASSEPNYSDQYAAGAMRLGAAHRTSRGAGTTVAVLDTGVQTDHPELSGSLVSGYDYVDDDSDPSEAASGALVGHGTHVAGIVHLTAPEARIMPMRVLDAEGRGDVFLIAEAVQGTVRRGADVVNLSLGSSEESELLEDVFEELAEPEDDDVPAVEGVPREGVVVVGSAGNNNTVVEQYPAAEDGMISVASVDAAEQKSEFTSFGGEWVDVAAPGEDIHSPFPTDGYASWTGTSMAAPFVAGQAALIRSVRPSLPAAPDDDDGSANASIEGIITSSARNLNDARLGSGHADAARSLAASNLAPTVTPGSPGPGARVKTRTPALAATVRDPGSTLAKSNIRVFVRGAERTNFNYNPSTGQLSFRSARLPYGATGVRVTATDALGKSTSRSWSFRVVRR
ncbi:S8 family serine peptidase [Rubrobacter indicoceani]|uniref:S8 family serine peptidase n=1 Tax=Rubrobacter indicoceani TaxID=2051957 RepID=UPI0013C40055|nr:S8 family serine peptidase [Rubrobacter indicoceani]